MHSLETLSDIHTMYHKLFVVGLSLDAFPDIINRFQSTCWSADIFKAKLKYLSEEIKMSQKRT